MTSNPKLRELLSDTPHVEGKWEKFAHKVALLVLGFPMSLLTLMTDI